MAREALRTLARSRIARALAAQPGAPVPVEVLPHHVRISEAQVEALFGRGHRLAKDVALSQPGEFVAREELAIVGPKGRIDGVRVFGPPSARAEVSIAMSEQFALGVHPPIRESGDVSGTPGCTLEGPAGTVKLEQGVVCAMRTLRMRPEDALRYGLRDRSVVRVRLSGARGLALGDVLVRVDPNAALALRIDADEAHAAGVATGATAIVEDIQSEE